jgi:uncharacterized membrane protein YraQ (UPF0718 family)
MILIDFVAAAAEQTFWVLHEGALFILLGFAIAGIIHVVLDPERIVRHLGGRSLRSAALAAVMGAPLPLCSCGVLPMAVSLRRKGASRESTLAFLITTPETRLYLETAERVLPRAKLHVMSPGAGNTVPLRIIQ